MVFGFGKKEQIIEKEVIKEVYRRLCFTNSTRA